MEKKDLTTRNLILLTIMLLLLPVVIFFWLDGDGPGDFGSLLAAFSGLIAVMWFYRGLRLQSIQINEQRNQFIKQFSLQHQDSNLAFLESSSKRLDKNLEELLNALNLPDKTQLTTIYMNSMIFYKTAIESKDPQDVMSEIKKWMKIEGPCVEFMTNVRDIVVMYKLRLGLENNSDGIDPAEFVYINSGHLMKQPFMSPYKTTVEMLSQQMNLLYPGRKAMHLAISATMAITAPAEDLVKTDKIIEDIEQAKKDGKLIPKICDVFMDSHLKKS